MLSCLSLDHHIPWTVLCFITQSRVEVQKYHNAQGFVLSCNFFVDIGRVARCVVFLLFWVNIFLL